MSDLAQQCATQVVKAKPFAKASLKLAKHSPEIMVGVGVVGMIAGTVLACRATLKAPAVVAAAKDKYEQIEEAKILGEEGKIDYTSKDRQQDLVAATFQTGVEFVKLYGLPVLVMSASIFAITKGHGITMKRNAAISSALATLTAGFKEYRGRVRERYGDEAERDLYYGVRKETIEVTDAKGKVRKEKVTVVTNPEGVSPYARLFDNNTIAWSPSPEMNLTFLRCQQNYANDILNVRGHIFLNEIYDMLGLPRSTEGSITGWIKGGEGDGYVDFGLRELDFYKLYEQDGAIAIPLDFNVDGLIYDLIS